MLSSAPRTGTRMVPSNAPTAHDGDLVMSRNCSFVYRATAIGERGYTRARRRCGSRRARLMPPRVPPGPPPLVLQGDREAGSARHMHTTAQIGLRAPAIQQTDQPIVAAVPDQRFDGGDRALEVSAAIQHAAQQLARVAQPRIEREGSVDRRPGVIVPVLGIRRQCDAEVDTRVFRVGGKSLTKCDRRRFELAIGERFPSGLREEGCLRRVLSDCRHAQRTGQQDGGQQAWSMRWSLEHTETPGRHSTAAAAWRKRKGRGV